MDSISYWLDLPYDPRPSLEGDITADVVIIGGGITGISATYHCAKQGLKTVLIEKNTIASGPAGRNGGMVVEGRSSDFANTVKKLGIETAIQAWQDTVDARELVRNLIQENGINCDVTESGSLYLGASDKDTEWLLTESEVRRTAGFSCETIEKATQLKESSYTAGLLNRKDLALHPVKFLRALATVSEGHGARIYDHTPALSFDSHSVTVANGTIHAKRVVIATEGDNQFAAEQDTHLIRSQALVTAPLSDEVMVSLDWHIGDMLWTTEDIDYASARKIGNRLFICKMLPLEPSAKDLEENKQWQLKKLHSFFPKLPETIEISHQWTCRMLETAENHPYIGLRNGCYEAFGHSGNGLTNGMMAGKMLSEYFGGKPLIELYSF